MLWETISEKVNDRFVVQRFVYESWETIGTHEVNGTTTERSEYSFVDASPELGTAYYRLKQFDTDGRFEYSEMRSVTVTPMTVQIAPNPSSGIFNIFLPIGLQNATLQLCDMQGRVIFETVSKGLNMLTIDVSDHSGMFVLSIVQGGYRSQHRVLIR